MGTIGEAGRDPGDIAHRLAAIERRLDAMASARRLPSASVGSGGVRVHSGGGIRVEGGGDIAVADGGTVLVTDENGDPQVRMGPLTNGGFGLEQLVKGVWLTLSTTLVAFGNLDKSATNFSIPTSSTVRASGSISVPSWADQAVVQAVATLSAHNPTAGISTAGVRCHVAGVGGGAHFVDAPFANAEITVSASKNRIITNPGASILVEATVSANVNWAANGQNLLDLDAVALFRTT